MRAKPLVYLSVSLNLILVILLLGRGERSRSEIGKEPKWTPQNEGPSSLESSGASVALLDEGEEVQPMLPTFRWSQIESEDYAKYIKNLRSVGCPESTIRDIVEADINQLFESRYLAMLADVQSFDYWRKGAGDLENQEMIRSAIAGLNNERDSYLRSLLGDSYVSFKTVAALSSDELLERSKLGFLDQAVQGSVVAIYDEYDALERQLRIDHSGLNNRLQLNQLLAENRKERRNALAELLSSDELLDLELRDSHAATSLRNKLGRFDVSESEFREMFVQRQAYELEHGEVPDYTSPDSIQERNLARSELESSYRQTLGENRYTDLQRQGDASWEALKRLEDNQGISRELMGQAYDLRREANAALMNNSGGQGLDDVEKLALNEAARAQYQREMTGLLGEEGFRELGELKEPPSISVFTGGAGDSASPIMILGGINASNVELPGSMTTTLFPNPNGGEVRVEKVMFSTVQTPTILMDTDSELRIDSTATAAGR